MTINFNHPVKELVWAGVKPATNGGDAATIFQRGPISNAATDTFLLKLNGHDRFAARPRNYFSRTQVWQHHTGYGCVQATNTDNWCLYLALKPETSTI